MVPVYQVKDRYSFKFVKVIADHVTQSCVYINGVRSSLSSEGVRYFLSFDEAKTYAVTLLTRRIVQSQRDLEIAQQQLAATEGISDSTIAVTNSTH